MRRAGLDYLEWAQVVHYANENEFIEKNKNRRIFACTTKTETRYSDLQYQDEDMFLFGPETKGLPPHLRSCFHAIKIPMKKESRSMNLSNATAIILMEAWRQLDFFGA
jgi:tRNA (cytidine/uridine-2'-O-)-methyltransferase